MLRDIAIHNYRSFKDFKISGLAPVNLLVGKNNSGKTTLLEAVYLLVNQGNPSSLIEILSHRGEITIEQRTRLRSEPALRRISQINHMFFGHKISFDEAIYIQAQKDYPLSIKIEPQATFQLRLPLYGDNEPDELDSALIFSYGQDIQIKIPIISDGTLRETRFFRLDNLSESDVSNSTSNQSLFLTTSNLSFESLAILWDRITLTPKEESVVAALQILDSNVERISFTSRQTVNSGILLKIRGQGAPIPLGSMGDGMRRILNLAMSAVTVENGFLLVDEIDTGLYYETQTDMWRLLLKIADQLKLQIFATTHSWDCVRAFQEALMQSEDTSLGKLFRLSVRGENIRPIAYTGDELAIAVAQDIEVR